MKINQFKNYFNLGFGKTLRANCSVLKDGKQFPCKIYQITPFEDTFYFSDKNNASHWEKAHYWSQMQSLFEEECMRENVYAPEEDVFVLEDENKNCLGFIDIATFKDDKPRKSVIFIEKCPNLKSGFKYIGETILNFIFGLAKQENLDYVCIPMWVTKALPFYINKCGFKYSQDSENGLFYPKERFDNFIEQNKSHTHSAIDYAS